MFAHSLRLAHQKRKLSYLLAGMTYYQGTGNAAGKGEGTLYWLRQVMVVLVLGYDIKISEN